MVRLQADNDSLYDRQSVTTSDNPENWTRWREQRLQRAYQARNTPDECKQDPDSTAYFNLPVPVVPAISPVNATAETEPVYQAQLSAITRAVADDGFALYQWLEQGMNDEELLAASSRLISDLGLSLIHI